MLTISAVENRWKIPRDAEFRDQLAIETEMLLFPAEEEDPPENGRLCCLIIHGRGFIDVAIPKADGKGYIPEARIRLLEEYEDVAASKFGCEEEIIQAPEEPEIRPEVQEGARKKYRNA